MAEDKIDIKPTSDELALYDDISKLAERLWGKTVGIRGFNTDPKMYSCVLFKRLWSNHRGYTLLWKNNFRLESDIILRSALEAAICLSALAELKEEFVLLMKQDAAYTITGQIKIFRDNNEVDLVRGYEEELRRLQNGLPAGAKAIKLDWKQLAASGNVPRLYDWHRDLSGVSSHVTGISVLDGFGGEGLNETQQEIRKLHRKMRLMMMAGATLQGSMRHAAMIMDESEVEAALVLINRMNSVSEAWSGVE